MHILNDNTLTQDNRDKFIYLAGRYNQLVKFYNVEKLCADKIAELLQSMPNVPNLAQSIATCYRFLIPQILPTETNKIIYIDSDVIVNLDIQEFWQINLDDAPLAAVPEMQSYVPTKQLHYLCFKNFVKAEDFFNAGVLFMNLKRLRKEEKNLLNGMQFYAKHPECDGNDQAILNYCFSTETVKLPLKFNVLVEYARMNNDLETADRICHYITSSKGKGLGLDTSDPFNRLWLKYFMKTPWFDEEAIGRLYSGFSKTYYSTLASMKNTMRELSTAMQGKARAFFISPADVANMKKALSIRDNEEIILSENADSIQKLIKAMKRSKGKKVFFIMIALFPVETLIKEGFVFGRDFLNGVGLLVPMPNELLNSYSLIKDM